jgi:hypothetical protein
VTNASNVCHKLNCILCHVAFLVITAALNMLVSEEKMPQHMKLLFFRITFKLLTPNEGEAKTFTDKML